MDFKQLTQIIFNELKAKIKKNRSLSIFAKERAKFEGWLKVEVIDILLTYSDKVRPEVNRVDVCFKNWGIELKTIATNYQNNKKKQKPITDQIQDVINDIAKLKKSKFTNKAILFIAFPVEPKDDSKWKKHLEKINSKLRHNLLEQEIPFNNKSKGRLYIGLID